MTHHHENIDTAHRKMVGTAEVDALIRTTAGRLIDAPDVDLLQFETFDELLIAVGAIPSTFSDDDPLADRPVYVAIARYRDALRGGSSVEEAIRLAIAPAPDEARTAPIRHALFLVSGGTQ